MAVGSASILARQAELLSLGPVCEVEDPQGEPLTGGLAVWDPAPDENPSYQVGEVTAEAGRIAMLAVDVAAKLCLAGRADGMVTAPISKEAIQLAGFDFPGHTEFLQERTGAPSVVMILASDLAKGALRVALVTIHVPVVAIAPLVTADRIVRVCTDVNAALKRDFGIARPKLALLGLNPHAGDGGVIGTEEATEIVPARERLHDEGIDVSGPFPADGFFGSAAWTSVDAVVAMYHDQGLAPFKALAMGGGVNISIGLPIVRTSPDHGTAFGIAGQGRADPGSMVEAILTAARIVKNRTRFQES